MSIYISKVNFWKRLLTLNSVNGYKLSVTNLLRVRWDKNLFNENFLVLNNKRIFTIEIVWKRSTFVKIFFQHNLLPRRSSTKGISRNRKSIGIWNGSFVQDRVQSNGERQYQQTEELHRKIPNWFKNEDKRTVIDLETITDTGMNYWASTWKMDQNKSQYVHVFVQKFACPKQLYQA